jgi:hypothetical protein
LALPLTVLTQKSRRRQSNNREEIARWSASRGDKKISALIDTWIVRPSQMTDDPLCSRSPLVIKVNRAQ